MGENTTCWYCVCCPLFRVIVILRVNYLFIAHFLSRFWHRAFWNADYNEMESLPVILPWGGEGRWKEERERKEFRICGDHVLSMLMSNGIRWRCILCRKWWFPHLMIAVDLKWYRCFDCFVVCRCGDSLYLSSSHPSSHSLRLWFLPIPMDHTVCVYKVLMSWLEIESILWFIALRRIEFAMWSPGRDWFVVMWSLWIIPLFGNWYYNHSNVFSSVLALFQCLRYLWGAEMKWNWTPYFISFIADLISVVDQGQSRPMFLSLEDLIPIFVSPVLII